MTATYDPALIERLVTTMRERYAKCGAVSSADALDAADQLEAAKAEVERWKLAAVRTVNGQRMDLSAASHARLTEQIRSADQDGGAEWLLETAGDIADALEDADAEVIKRTAERDALRAEVERLKALVEQLTRQLPDE